MNLRSEGDLKAVLVESLGNVDECFQTERGRAGFIVFPFFLANERPGDVEMRPRRFLRYELLKKQAGRESTTNGTADIVDVGVRRLQHFFVFGGKRQFPECFALVCSRV